MTRHVNPAELAGARKIVIPGRRGLVSVRADAKTPAELMADLNKTFEQFKAANDERLKAVEAKGSADTVLNEKVDRINADITKISNEWKAAVAEVEKKLNRPGLIGLDDVAAQASLKDFNLAVIAHAKLHGRNKPAVQTPENLATYRAGFDQFVRVGEKMMATDVQNAMMVGSDPQSGYLVLPEMDRAIDKLARDQGAMRAVAQQRTIGASAFKKMVQTSGAAAGGWGNERTTPSETAGPRLAELSFTPGTLWAEPQVTTELLEDASMDVEGYLAEEIGITFNEQEEDAFVDGDGVEKPKGVLSYDKVANASWEWGKLGFTITGHASDFAAANPSDKLIDLVHSLKRQYRGNAAFQMNDPTLAKIRKFKDGQGNYMWVPDIKQGIVGVLFGYPVVTNDFFPDTGADAFPVAFGDWRRGYLIVDRRGTVMLRDPYTAKPYVKFWSTRRVGGGVQNFQAIKLLKCSAA